MIKLEIIDKSLQVSLNSIILLVTPKNLCAIDVLSLYDAIPLVVIYNKYLGNFTSIFSQPLSECTDGTGTPFTISSFIAFAEANLGFDSITTAGITSINGLTDTAQTLTVGTSGTDFEIVDSGFDHKFNLPIASALNTGKLSNTNWITFNDKQNALGFTPSRPWFSGVNGATVSNTITITPTYTQLILANTFVARDVIYTNFRAVALFAKTSVTNIYIYINTTNNLLGTPILIGFYTGTASTRTIQMERTLAIKGTTSRFAPTGNSVPTDNAIGSASTTASIDWTIDQYIIFAIGHTVADQTMLGDMYKVVKM
jgi:hypothetical protein